MTRWLLTLLLVLGCEPNYCPNGPLVFAVEDARLLPATEGAVRQLSPHMQFPIKALPVEKVTHHQWDFWIVWRVVSVTENDPRSVVCDPFEGDPEAYLFAETDYVNQVLFVCDRFIEAHRLQIAIMHEIGHVIGGPDHSPDPDDIMFPELGDRNTYTENDIALITATCG